MTYCNKPNSRTMLISVYQNILKLPYTFTNTIADNIIHIYFLYTNKSINKDIHIYILDLVQGWRVVGMSELGFSEKFQGWALRSLVE